MVFHLKGAHCKKKRLVCQMSSVLGGFVGVAAATGRFNQKEVTVTVIHISFMQVVFQNIHIYIYISKFNLSVPAATGRLYICTHALLIYVFRYMQLFYMFLSSGQETLVIFYAKIRYKPTPLDPAATGHSYICTYLLLIYVFRYMQLFYIYSSSG